MNTCNTNPRISDWTGLLWCSEFMKLEKTIPGRNRNEKNPQMKRRIEVKSRLSKTKEMEKTSIIISSIKVNIKRESFLRALIFNLLHVVESLGEVNRIGGQIIE